MRQIEGKYHPCADPALSRESCSARVSIFWKISRTTSANSISGSKHGKINIPLQHKIDPEGFEPLRKTLDSIANRLTNAILTASVLICSSILVLSGLPPKLGGVSIVGLAGLIWGTYLCLRLVLVHLETRRSLAGIIDAGYRSGRMQEEISKWQWRYSCR